MRTRLVIIFIFSCLMMAKAAPDSLRVGLVTCWPGPDIYELEGHTAIHIQGRFTDRPIDVALNYGLFDFNAPNFVYRFVKGETDYWCGMMDWSHFVAPYIAQGRKIVEHPIPMDSIQTERLISLINDNMLPQNRVYRYNYVKDNCATRPLRVIEKALGDSIILPEPTGRCRDDNTFRDIMRRHHKNYPWYQFGIDLALGSGLDYPINIREKSFAPTLLNEQLDSATVNGRRLTGDPIVVYQGMGDRTLGATPWYLTPLAVGWLLFALSALLTAFDIRHGKVSKWFDTLLYLAYGIAGIVVAFLVFISVHEASSPNLLILWLNPLCLIVPIFIWLKKCKNIVISYQIINFALILIMIVAWLPSGQSGNVAFIPLIGCDLMRSISYVYITKRRVKALKKR